MIKTVLTTADQTTVEGDGDLISQWQASSDSFIWVDLFDENPEQERAMLLHLGCHELAISDAHRLRHPPKLEEFEDFTFFIYRGFRQFDDSLNIDTVQLAFWVGERILITRRNAQAFSIDNIWQHPKRNSWVAQPALLAMRIIVASANGYISGILQFEQTLSELEESMLERANDELMQNLVVYRSRLRQLKRVFSYHERIFKQLQLHPSTQFAFHGDEISHQIQDAYEKMERLNSLTTMYHELCGDLLDGYLSISSHRLNNTMRVLTVITAVFVPLGFLAGIYGMNFEIMPELSKPNGYYVLLASMATIATVLLGLFRFKKWI